MVFTVFRLLTDFVCLYTYEFCKIFRSSVILLLPLFMEHEWVYRVQTVFKVKSIALYEGMLLEVNKRLTI